MRSFILAAILAASLASITAAQEPCDFNRNGFVDATDGTWMIGLLNRIMAPDTIAEYWPLADCDCDGVHLTISDAIALFEGRLVHGINWGRGQLVKSDIDTISIRPVSAYPGQTLDIPIFLSTDRELYGIQFYIRYNPDIIQVLGYTWNDTSIGHRPPYHFKEGLAAYYFKSNLSAPVDPIGSLSVLIRDDITPPLETQIEFADDPYSYAYTGLSSSGPVREFSAISIQFIRPVKIDGGIHVVQTSADEGTPTKVYDLGLTAYPNPFNAATTISVKGADEVEVEIFDIAGREVASLVTNNGQAVWPADGLSSGVYFARAAGERASAAIKLILMK